jgi:CubicO group peptidase (beta-lactamase class C family)
MMFARPAAAQDSARLVAEIDRFVRDSMPGMPFSGVVAVSRAGQPVLARAYGTAHYEASVPVTVETRFLIGSLQKQFTSAAVLLLQERGRLSVDDPLCRYVEPCPAAWEPVRLRHLLTHSSGIPDIFAVGFGQTRMLPRSHDEIVALFRDQPLQYAPGERFRYNNSGFILLGQIISRAAGMPWTQFMRDSLFAPLGMRNTGFADNAEVVAGMASGYSARAGKVIRAQFEDRTTATADGNSTWSTAGDLLVWVHALRSGRVLAPASLAAMFGTHIRLDSGARAGQEYGHGWYTQRTGGATMFSHGGVVPGFRSYAIHLPASDVTVMVLSNSELDVRPLAERVAAAFGFPPSSAQGR